VDAQDRPDLHADRNMQFSISGPGVIAAVGNANEQDPDSYHGDHSKLYQGRALVVIRTSQQTGTINPTAQATGLSQAAISLCAKAANRLPGLMVAPGGTMRGGLSTKGRNRAIRGQSRWCFGMLSRRIRTRPDQNGDRERQQNDHDRLLPRSC
jgi:Glycoside hydrolase family 2 C-terminal domain 5